MSWKTFFYIFFLLFIFYRILDDTDFETISLKEIIEKERNISISLDKLTFNETVIF